MSLLTSLYFQIAVFFQLGGKSITVEKETSEMTVKDYQLNTWNGVIRFGDSA